MFGALLYLRLTSLKNWLRMRLLRLKQPKYFAGAIVGVAYFWFFFFRRSFSGGSGARRQSLQQASQALEAAGVTLPGPSADLGLAIGATLLLVLVLLTWVFSLERASLGFTEAEIAFLFPAPITRNRLVQFRLLDVQLRSLVGVLFMTLISNRWTFLGGSVAGRAVGWWLVFAGFNLHLTAVRFTLTRLADRELGTWRRRALIVAGFIAVVALTLALLPPGQRQPDFSKFATHDVPAAVSQWFLRLTSSAPLGWLLWPAKFLLGPFFADNGRAFLLSLGPALLVVAAHYWWVLRSVVSFEEGSIARAEKRAAVVAARRSGQGLGRAPTKGRRPPFQLAGTGRPEFAFLWKNLLSTFPWLTVRTWAACALLIVGGAVWVNAHPEWRGLWVLFGPTAAILAGYTLIAGPQFARQDIRADLTNADLLKTYPLPGWQIVLGELLTPSAILTGILWLLLLAAAAGFQPGPHAFASWAPKLREFAEGCAAPSSRVLIGLGVALLVPPVVALQLLVPNAAALVFPGWFQATRQRGGGGIDVMGQRLIFFFAQLLTMLFALLPAVLVGFATVSVACFALRLPTVIGVWLAAGTMLVLLIGEIWLAVYLLGERFEKLDLSAEIRP